MVVESPAPPATEPDGRLTRRLARGAAGTFALNIANSVLNLLIAVVLTRVLSLSDYGLVIFVIAVVMLLSVPAGLGLDRLLTQRVAVHDRRGELADARAVVSGSRMLALAAAGLLAAGAALVTLIASDGVASPVAIAMWVGLAALPLATWNRVQQGATLGMRRIVAAQAPEMLVRPLAFVSLVGLAVLVAGPPLSPQLVLGLFVLSFACAVAIGTVFLVRGMRVPGNAPANRRSYPSIRSAASFAIISGAAVINNQAGIILLGILATTELSGLYGAAARLALLIPFALTAINAVLSPTAARLWDAGRLEELRRLVTLSARVTLICSVPPALAFILFGGWFLDLAFPPAFTAAAPALAILSLGQLANAAMGSAGTLLTMAHRERQAAVGVTIGAAVTVLASVLLIPVLGVEGAAWAGALSLVTWNVWLAVMTRRELGIDSTALGLHPRSRDGDAMRIPDELGEATDA
jgi:O-antigen/teichoic acid export membrane protein